MPKPRHDTLGSPQTILGRGAIGITCERGRPLTFSGAKDRASCWRAGCGVRENDLVFVV